MKPIITDLSYKSLFAKRSNPHPAAKGKPGKTSIVLAAPAPTVVPQPEPPSLVSRKLYVVEEASTTKLA